MTHYADMNHVVYDITEIRERIANRGLTQTAAARLAGIHERTLNSFLLTGRAHPLPAFLIAKALGMDVERHDLKALKPKTVPKPITRRKKKGKRAA